MQKKFSTKTCQRRVGDQPRYFDTVILKAIHLKLNIFHTFGWRMVGLRCHAKLSRSSMWPTLGEGSVRTNCIQPEHWANASQPIRTSLIHDPFHWHTHSIYLTRPSFFPNRPHLRLHSFRVAQECNANWRHRGIFVSFIWKSITLIDTIQKTLENSIFIGQNMAGLPTTTHTHVHRK